MQLVNERKIKLNDPISKYIPNFHMKYKGKKVEITINQLITQTSGIQEISLTMIKLQKDG